MPFSSDHSPRHAHSPSSYASGSEDGMPSVDAISVLEEGDVNTKPPYSYVILISQAIRAAPSAMVTLGNIYKYIDARYPYYRALDVKRRHALQNSIRHNLSLNACFVKLTADGQPASSSHKGNFWGLRNDEVTDFQFSEEGCRRRRRVVKSKSPSSAGGVKKPRKAARRQSAASYQSASSPQSEAQAPLPTTNLGTLPPIEPSSISLSDTPIVANPYEHRQHHLALPPLDMSAPALQHATLQSADPMTIFFLTDTWFASTASKPPPSWAPMLRPVASRPNDLASPLGCYSVANPLHTMPPLHDVVAHHPGYFSSQAVAVSSTDDDDSQSYYSSFGQDPTTYGSATTSY